MAAQKAEATPLPFRRLTEQQWPATHLAQSIAIASGKGGVGKSNVAVNIALELASFGHNVTLLDADMALANVDVLLGLTPKYHLGHVLSGRKTLKDIEIPVVEGLRLIPGGSGVAELATLTSEQNSRLLNELRAIEAESDFMIVDTAAGIAANVTGILKSVTEAVIVTTPDPTALVDAYATIKLCHQASRQTPIKIIVNDVNDNSDADRVFKQLSATSKRFLNREIEHLGTIPHDTQLVDAVREQTPVVQYAPETPSSRALRMIARHIEISRTETVGARNRSFWSALTALDQ